MDLSQLIDLYRGPLLGLIASWGGPWVVATEIAQDSFAEAYLNRGDVWDEKGSFDLAISDYTKALNVKPDFAEAYNNRGLARQKKGDLDQALGNPQRQVLPLDHARTRDDQKSPAAAALVGADRGRVLGHGRQFSCEGEGTTKVKRPGNTSISRGSRPPGSPSN